MDRRSFLKSCVAAATMAASPSLVLAAGMGGDGSRSRQARALMGTVVTIQCAGCSQSRAVDAMGAAFAEMESLCAVFNRHDPASALSTLNASGRLDHAPDELLLVLDETRRVHLLSGRVFDPTVAPLVDLFGKWDGRPGGLDRTAFRETLELVGDSGVIVSGRSVSLARRGMGLTLDGAAKGHITDRAARVLENHGVRSFLIDSGGDVLARGVTETGRGWRVAVQHPSLDPHARPLAVVELRDKAMATSGGYETAKGPGLAFNHMVDPRTGLSPRILDSATVTAPTLLEADSLATALFVLGPERGMEMINARPGREALAVTTGGGRRRSRNWSA